MAKWNTSSGHFRPYCTELYGGNITHNAGLILLLISDEVTRNAGCVATKMTKKKSAIFQNFLATTDLAP